MTGTETAQSFSVLNYSGLLYNKADTRTPFLNAISGKVEYTNSTEFVTGQYYTSEEGEIPSISETASLTAPTGTFVTRTQLSNLTQIFMEKVAVSYAKLSNMAKLSGVNIAGQSANPINEEDFQIAQKMMKIKRSIEKTFIQGAYNKATTDSEVNKTRGMNEAITSNVIAATSGSELDIWLVNDLMEKIYDNQGDISNLTLWVDATSLNQLNSNAVKSGIKMGEPYMSTYGVQVHDLLLPLGTVHIVLGEFIPAGTAYLFNLGVIAPVEQQVPGKGNFFLEPLAKTGAGDSSQIFGQIGLDHGPEWYHGKITGLSTTFVKPNDAVNVNVTNTVTNPVNTKQVSA